MKPILLTLVLLFAGCDTHYIYVEYGPTEQEQTDTVTKPKQPLPKPAPQRSYDPHRPGDIT